MDKRVKNGVRPDLDEYFLKVASVVAERSTCRRHNIGAVAVRDKHILATGYNGAPAGLKDCLELGCMRDELGIVSGTELLTVNGRELADFLDWEFLTADDELIIEARLPDGEAIIYEVERPEGEGMGVELEPPPIRRCANRCEFCFI